MDVSIIIVNYNTFALTKAAIESVFEKTEGITYEVILVDNNSPDESGKQLQGYFSSKIVYIQSPENVGFGRANNLGIEKVKGRNIFLLNPDTLLLNNAVKILSDFLNNNPNVGVCGGNLYDILIQPAQSFVRYLPSLYWELDVLLHGLLSKIRYSKNVYFNHIGSPLNVGYIIGADMMIRKAVFDEVGVFDPDFFMYYEETELSYRIKQKGYQIKSVPDAKIIHLEGQSLKISDVKIKYFLNGRKIYYQKNKKVMQRIAVDIVYVLTCITRIFIFTLLANKYKVNMWLIRLIRLLKIKDTKNVSY